jgi:hypothetical protein
MLGLSFGDAKTRWIAFAAVTATLVAVGVTFWFSGTGQQSARDYEECVEALGSGAAADRLNSLPGDERSTGLTACNAQFAGRRKPGGGYSYYDFMQDRNFDIAGPNPTSEERTKIDREYIQFLDAQRREAIASDLAKKHDEQLRADLERARQPVGAPLVLTPKSQPSPAAKRLVDRSAGPRCEEDSLACHWSRFSTAVKNAFASSPARKP